jgi:hypothetical protein
MMGCEIPNWVVVVFDRRCHDAHDIAQSLVRACNKRGMRVSDPKAVEKEPQKNQFFPPDERVRRMFHFLTHHRPMFILAVLPDKDSEIYDLFTPYITFLCVKHAELWSVSMVTAVLNTTNTTLMLRVIPEVVGNLVNGGCITILPSLPEPRDLCQ